MLGTILKIRTGEGSMTDDHPSNWQNNEELRKVGKNGILLKHTESLLELLDLLKQKNDTFLDETYFDTDFKNYYLTFITCYLHFLIFYYGISTLRFEIFGAR